MFIFSKEEVIFLLKGKVKNLHFFIRSQEEIRLNFVWTSVKWTYK